MLHTYFMFMFSSNLLRNSHCKCFEIVRLQGKGSLRQRCRYVVPVLSQSCPRVVLKQSQKSFYLSTACLRVVQKLSQRCPNIVLKLCQSCLQVVSRFPQKYLKPTSKEQVTKVIPSLYPSCYNMWTMWEHGAKIILKCSVLGKGSTEKKRFLSGIARIT